jgi:hypothetical protein
MDSPLTEAPQIYYAVEHALYYIFDRAGELDITMTRNVQNHNWTLYYYTVDQAREHHNWTLYYTAAKYYIRSPLGDVMSYDLCSTHKFNDWYRRQPHLGVFIMANGIPSYFCTASSSPLALPAPSAPPALQAPAPTQKNSTLRKKPTKPHLVSLVLKAAIDEKRVCPITFDPITESSTCIAPCYHSFDNAAIDNWLETNTTCPECRETCVE